MIRVHACVRLVFNLFHNVFFCLLLLFIASVSSRNDNFSFWNANISFWWPFNMLINNISFLFLFHSFTVGYFIASGREIGSIWKIVEKRKSSRLWSVHIFSFVFVFLCDSLCSGTWFLFVSLVWVWSMGMPAFGCNTNNDIKWCGVYVYRRRGL